MRYRSFGNTGLEVSILGMGCMRLPVLNQQTEQIDVPAATRMVHHAIEYGVNYLDTAYSYHSSTLSSGGASEPFLAGALEGGYRQKVFLATKLPCWLVESHDDMERLLDEQLNRMHTDAIDFYLLHSLNRDSWNRMMMLDVGQFLDRSLEKGKIRYAGFSFHDELALFGEIVKAYPWSFCQIMYNYFDEHFQAGRDGLSMAAQKGLGTVIMEPLRGGALVHGLPKEAKIILQQSVPGRSLAGWAFRWLWNQQEISLTLSGMSTMDQLKENLGLADTAGEDPWSESETEAILKVTGIIRRLQKVPCTECGYCMPCPHGVNIPRNFTLCNDYYMLQDKGAIVRYQRLLKEEQRASSCIRCGECIEKCPQQIAIPDELEHVAKLLG